MKRYRSRKRAIIFVGYCIVLIMLAAAFFLIYWKERRNFPAYEDIHHFNPTREGGHLLPNLDQWVKGERLGQRVRIITNSRGFRADHEFAYDKPDHTLRILFLGDSFVDGMRTDQKETIGYLLEEFLDARLRGGVYNDVEVMISGQNNPTNSWYNFQEYGWKYHPDLTLVGVTLGNDLTSYNYNKGMIPTQRADGSVVLKLAAHVRQGVLRNRQLILPDDAYTHDHGYWEFLQDLDLKVRRLLAYTRLADLYDVPPLLGPNPSARRHVYACGFYVSPGLYYQPLLPQIERLYSDFEAVMAGIKASTERHGSRLLVVLFPVRAQVISSDWDLLVRYYSLDPTRFDLTYPNRRISAFCEEKGIHLVDLLPAFREFARRNDESLYRSRGDMHFNERGQRLAAEVLADAILETGWFQSLF